MLTSTIASFATGIGNFVLYTPALQALASMDASGKIDICADADWEDSRKAPLIALWKTLPFVQDVIEYPFSSNKAQFTKDYKVWYWTIWTTHGRVLEWFKHKHPYTTEWDQKEEHELDFYMRIAREKYGYKGETPAQYFPVADKPIIDSKALKIVLCNGGFGHIAVFKKWNYFPQLAHELKMFYGSRVAVIKIGRGSELEDVGEFDYNYVGKLSLAESAKVIQQADLVITTDTGNMHIADTLCKPMIILWGGSYLSKNRPVNGPAKVLHLGLRCQPCQKSNAYQSCTTIQCLRDITVGEVMYNVRKFIDERKFT